MHRADADYFPYWCYVISFPVMLVVLVLHLILHNLHIFGVIVGYPHTAWRVEPGNEATLTHCHYLLHRATCYWVCAWCVLVVYSGEMGVASLAQMTTFVRKYPLCFSLMIGVGTPTMASGW